MPFCWLVFSIRCVSVSVLWGLPRQTWPVCHSVWDAASESGLLYAHALHTSCAVSLFSCPEVSNLISDSISPLTESGIWASCLFNTVCFPTLSFLLCTRFVEWIPEVPADVRWLFGVAGDVYRQTWKGSPSGSVRWWFYSLVFNKGGWLIYSICALKGCLSFVKSESKKP